MKKVLLGIPSASGFMPTMMVHSLLQLEKPIQCGFLAVERQRVDKARNYLVSQCLAGGYDYLMMVDDDNPIPPESLSLMLEDDKDIVIAPIMSRNRNEHGKFTLCAYYERWVGSGKEKFRIYDNIETFREEGPLHQIHAGGTGCILIKREVLEKLNTKYDGAPFEFGDIRLKKPVYIDGKKYERRTMSEDVEFCERAIDNGFELWLDDRVRPIHISSPQLLQWKP